MKTTYRTSGAFFVSAVGRRLQKQIKSFFADDIFEKNPVIFIGAVSPFLAAFEQNNPDILWENERLTENELLPSFSSFQNINIVFITVSNDSVADNLPFLIKEAYRLLKPQGRLFILIKNKQHLKTVCALLPQNVRKLNLFLWVFGLIPVQLWKQKKTTVFRTLLNTWYLKEQRKETLYRFPKT